MSTVQRPRGRSAAAFLPALLTAAALVAAPFAGTTTGPLVAAERPASGAATVTPQHRDAVGALELSAAGLVVLAGGGAYQLRRLGR